MAQTSCSQSSTEEQAGGYEPDGDQIMEDLTEKCKISNTVKISAGIQCPRAEGSTPQHWASGEGRGGPLGMVGYVYLLSVGAKCFRSP